MARAHMDKAAEEEFLGHLYRGGDLLAAGKVIEAKDHLERAFQLNPKNEKAQNLLGLSYFKLGLFDRAAEIYEALVRENPVDPTLRVNLGLVYLKGNDLGRAIRELETATDLEPEHGKAQSYLGLALAQNGDYARAREHFKLAGSEAMVEKMTRALEGASGPTQAEATVGISAPPQPPAKSPPEAPIAAEEAALPLAEESFEVMSDEEAPSRELESAEVLAPAGPPPAAPAALQATDWGAQFGAPREEEDAGSLHGAVQAIELQAEEVPAPQLAVSGEEEEGTLTAALANAVMEVAQTAEPGDPGMAVEALAAEAGYLDPMAGLGVEMAADFSVGAEAAEVEAPLAEAAPGMEAAVEPAALPGGEDRLESPAAPRLVELASTIRLSWEPAGGPFQVGPEVVALAVRGEMLARLDGVLVQVGALKASPEVKRYRGKSTDQPFGEGLDQLMRLQGEGAVFLRKGSWTFTVVELEDESAYFREPCVFAFEEPVMFENGRLTSEVPPDLDLVHLRGQGKVLLRVEGPLRSLPVTMERSIWVLQQGLVGWCGSVAPRLVPFAPEASGRPVQMAVELTGEGEAFVALAPPKAPT